MSSCERPPKSSARDFVPPSVSKLYSFSIGTQGSSRRCRASSSLRRVSFFSSARSSSRAVCHSSWVPTLSFVITLPPAESLHSKLASERYTHLVMLRSREQAKRHARPVRRARRIKGGCVEAPSDRAQGLGRRHAGRADRRGQACEGQRIRAKSERK